MTQRLQDALGDVRSARAFVRQVLLEDYPAGSDIAWAYHGKVRQGIVIQHTPYNERIEVLNAATGKSYWIAATVIVSPF